MTIVFESCDEFSFPVGNLPNVKILLFSIDFKNQHPIFCHKTLMIKLLSKILIPFDLLIHFLADTFKKVHY